MVELTFEEGVLFRCMAKWPFDATYIFILADSPDLVTNIFEPVIIIVLNVIYNILSYMVVQIDLDILIFGVFITLVAGHLVCRLCQTFILLLESYDLLFLMLQHFLLVTNLLQIWFLTYLKLQIFQLESIELTFLIGNLFIVINFLLWLDM